MTKADTTLFQELREAFNPQSKAQEEAWEMLEEIGLPSKKSEAYKFTPITSTLEKKLDLTLNSTYSFTKGNMYQVEGHHLVIVNGKLDNKLSNIGSELNLSIEKVSNGKHDPFSLLNTAFSSEEIAIKLKKSNAPIFIYTINSAGFSNPRVKVSAEENSEATIIEKPINGNGVFSNPFIQFDLAANAKVNYTKVQQYHKDSYTHETVVAHQARDSRFYSNVFSFSGGLIRNNLYLSLDDENCEGYMYGLYLLDQKSHVDNNTSVDHIKPHSYSNELYKGIIDDQSTGVFNGKIYVRPQAQKTNAFQSNNNILLSDTASLHTKPQLEIWADDVKCSHGCTSGQLDEDAIFYLRARGIDERTAKAMILNAFAAETMSHVPVNEVKAELEALIEKRLV